MTDRRKQEKMKTKMESLVELESPSAVCHLNASSVNNEGSVDYPV